MLGGSSEARNALGPEGRFWPRPAAPPDESAAQRGLKRDAWVIWAVLSLCIVVFAAIVVTMSLVGDWDDPMPPNPVAAWSVAGIAAASTLFVAWRTRNRWVMKTAIVAVPLQALYWVLMVMPAAGQPN